MIENYDAMRWECIRIGKAPRKPRDLVNVDFWNEERNVHICLDIEPEFVSKFLRPEMTVSCVFLMELMRNAIYEVKPIEGGITL